jgi:hypothetical protein
MAGRLKLHYACVLMLSHIQKRLGSIPAAMPDSRFFLFRISELPKSGMKIYEVDLTFSAC